MLETTKHSAGSLSEPLRSPQARIARVVGEASGRVGKVVGEAANDIVAVVRDEVGRLAALFKPELLAAGKGLMALSVAALGGLCVLVLVNVAILHLLTLALPLPVAALVLAGGWGAVAFLALRFARTQAQRLIDLKGAAREGPPG